MRIANSRAEDSVRSTNSGTTATKNRAAFGLSRLVINLRRKMQPWRCADGSGLDRPPAFLPAIGRKPREIERASPPEAFISEAVTQHQRSAAKPDRDPEKR